MMQYLISGYMFLFLLLLDSCDLLWEQAEMLKMYEDLQEQKANIREKFYPLLHSYRVLNPW